MLVSKPKINALLAIGVFAVICLSLSLVNLNIIFQGGSRWYNYLIVLTVLPMALVIIVRQLINYKVISAGKNSIKVVYPFMKKSFTITLKDLVSWEETVIKTKNDHFKELTLLSDRHRLKLSIQENTNYEKIKNYLIKNAGGKKVMGL